MRELTQEELNEVAGGVTCTGFLHYIVFSEICCGPTLPENYTNCSHF